MLQQVRRLVTFQPCVRQAAMVSDAWAGFLWATSHTVCAGKSCIGLGEHKSTKCAACSSCCRMCAPSPLPQVALKCADIGLIAEGLEVRVAWPDFKCWLLVDAQSACFDARRTN